MTGHSGGATNRDTWVIKINGSGDVIWSDCFGGAGNESTGGLEITSDGGAVIAGGTTSADGDVTGNHGAKDMWVLKLNSLGGLQWQQCYGGTADDAATYLQAITDGNFILTGFTHSENGDVTGNHGGGGDEWVVKIGPTGNLLWQHCLGGSDNDFAQCIQQTGDGGYIVSGYTFSTDYDVTGNHGLSDCWIVKLDATGGIVWQRAYGGSGGEIGSFIRLTTDGGYIFTGYTNSTDGDVVGNDDGSGSWVVKLAGTTGVEAVASETTISIYPNPATDLLTLNPGSYSGSALNIHVTDQLGRLLLTKAALATAPVPLNISSLRSGVYYLSVEARGERQALKFVKE